MSRPRWLRAVWGRHPGLSPTPAVRKRLASTTSRPQVLHSSLDKNVNKPSYRDFLVLFCRGSSRAANGDPWAAQSIILPVFQPLIVLLMVTSPSSQVFPSSVVVDVRVVIGKPVPGILKCSHRT